jgi:hypothetical protein
MLLLLGTIDESASFAEIEVSIRLVLHALNLEQRGVLLLCAVVSSVTGEHGLRVQTFL